MLVAEKTRTFFRDLEADTVSAFRLVDGRSVVKISTTQEGFNAIQLPMLSLVKIDEGTEIKHYDGKVGFKQA